MKMAVILFTYNRSMHTQKVLDALSHNEILPEALFIFQDGLKEEAHRSEWEKVKRVIGHVSWCKTQVIEAKENKGLADSIVDGVAYVFRTYDAVIVLEDDCVPHRKFMTFMTESLHKYASHKQVYSISGYTNPVEVPPNGTDAYFTRRAESLGWGTWKDRWSEYRVDYRMIYRIKNDPERKKQYEIWGADLESYLHGNIDGRCNSWAAFWSLLMIEKEGYCLAPYESLIDNIGFDGTGVHNGATPIKQILRDPQNNSDFVYPDEIVFPQNYEEIFSHYFATTSKEKKLELYNSILGRWIQNGGIHIREYFKKNRVENIAIWGTGLICDLLTEKLSDDIKINYIVKSNTREEETYKGIPVVKIEDGEFDTDLLIIIPVYDLEHIIYQHPSIKQYRYIGIDDLIG